MPCCGKRVSYNPTNRKVAISPSGSTLPISSTNPTTPIPNNVNETCVHVFQVESTISFGGKNYRKMKCGKCGQIKTVYLV